MSTPLRILILEDNPYDAELEIAALQAAGYACRWERVVSRADFQASLDSPEPGYDLILADYHLPDFDGLTALKLFLERGLDIPFILVSGMVGEETAIESLKAGATDYVLKDRLSRLGPVVERALREKEERQARKQAEEQLRESEERFRNLFEQAGDGLAIHDHKGNIVAVNQALCSLFGYTQQEMCELHLSDTQSPDSESTQTRSQAFQRLMQEGYVHFEADFVTKLGNILMGEVTSSLVEIGDEKLYYAQFKDITERVRAEQREKEALARLRLAMESAGQGVWEWDYETGLVSFDEMALGMVGYEAGFPPQPAEWWVSQIHPDEISLVEQTYAAFVAGDVARYSVEFRLKRKDSGYTWVASVARVIRYDKHGDPLLVVGIHQDITERKRAEEQLKQALAEKTTLLQELYHRTKNNMQVIHAMLALRASHVQDEQLLTILADVQNKIQAMALVHQKLYQSRNLSSINLKEYIDDLTAYLLQNYKVQINNISLELDIQSVPVLIDIAVPCGLILSELISNVFKHAFPDNRAGQIRIRLRQAEDRTISLRVSDNGIGLPDDFEARKRDSLGLQTVSGIVEHQLQGQLNLNAEQGVSWHIQFKDSLYRPRV